MNVRIATFLALLFFCSGFELALEAKCLGPIQDSTAATNSSRIDADSGKTKNKKEELKVSESIASSLTALKSEDPKSETFKAAAMSLGPIARERVAKRLCQQLSSSDQKLRQRAALTLCLFTELPKSAIPLLLNASKNDLTMVRRQALKVLCVSTGDSDQTLSDSTVAFLKDRLDEPDAQCRAFVAAMLLKADQNDMAAKTELKSFIGNIENWNHRSPELRIADEKKRAMRFNPLEPLNVLLSCDSQMGWMLVVEVLEDDLASTQLKDAILRDVQSQYLAFWSSRPKELLEKFPPRGVRSPFGTPVKKLDLKTLEANLKSQAPIHRRDAIYYVRKMAPRTPELLPALIELLEDDGFTSNGMFRFYVSERAAEAIVGMGEMAVPSLIAKLKSTDADARFFAAKALGAIGEKKAIKPLSELLADETSKLSTKGKIKGLQQVQLGALLALSKFGPETEPFASQFAKFLDASGRKCYEKYSLREAAVIAIGNTRSAGLKHVAKLKELLSKSTSDREQKEIKLALAKLTFEQPPSSNEMQKLFKWISENPTSMMDRTLARQAFEFIQSQGEKAKGFIPELKFFVEEHTHLHHEHRIFAAFALAHLDSENPKWKSTAERWKLKYYSDRSQLPNPYVTLAWKKLAQSVTTQ